MKNCGRGWLRLTCLLVLLTGTAERILAHSMYQSDVKLDFAGGIVHAELQLPLERVAVVFGRAVDSHTLHINRAALAAYVMSRFHVRDTEGRLFRTQLDSPLEVAQVDGAPYLVVRMALTPPEPSKADKLEIEDEVILGSMPSQVALVSIRSDWNTSVFADDPQLVGVLRSSSRSMIIDREGQSWFRGFASVFRLGIRHIAEGTDHLLFLLALLLPAPLLVSAGKWAGAASLHKSLLRILQVVTAFTAGHSITLALAALGVIHVPGRPIEVLIALSILVSAIHALRPLFPGREAGIAAFFGLIHGLAFATTIGGLGLGRWERIASILAFNFGIETMQLIVVAATMPSLVLLSRTASYSAVRTGGAVFAGTAAAGWIIERVLDVHSKVDFVVDRVAHQAGWIAGILFLVSVACWTRSKFFAKKLMAVEQLPAPTPEAV